MRYGKAIFAFLLVALTIFASQAQAIPITGGIAITGAYNLVGGSNLQTATAVTVSSSQVQMVTGTYQDLNVPIGNSANPVINYPGFSIANPMASYTPMWSFSYNGNTFEFDLTTANIVDRTTTLLTMEGYGTLKINGYDDTPAIWAWSGNLSGGTLQVRSFSDSAAAVPEAGTFLLLGTAFLSIGLLKRKSEQ